MSFLESYADWLQREELSAREDAARVAKELAAVARSIASGARIEAGQTLVDIGAGTGAIAMAAADDAATVVGIDIDRDPLRRGRELSRAIGAPVGHVAADARALPFGDAAFDASVHRSVLVYMTDRPRAVEEERRVLRPGGRVSCSESLGADLDLEVPDPGIARVWQGGLRDLLTENQDAFALTGGELEDLYRAAGFENVRVSVEPRTVRLESPDAVARAFASSPPAGQSARDRWQAAGVPAPLIDEFLARLARAAEQGAPAILLASEAFLTARAPS